MLLLWKKNHFLKCCIFGESHQILVTWFLVFGSSLHCAGKCTAKFILQQRLLEPGKVYRKNKSLNCQLISNSVIQIHLFCLVRYYAGLTLVVFSSYRRKNRQTRLLFNKNNWFRFSSVQLYAFESMNQSTNI